MTSAQISFKATDTANHVAEQVYDNINPAATPTQIRDFVQNVDDLSPDTYSDVSLTVRDVVIGSSPDSKVPKFGFGHKAIAGNDDFTLFLSDISNFGSYFYYSQTTFPMASELLMSLMNVQNKGKFAIFTETDAVPCVVSAPENIFVSLMENEYTRLYFQDKFNQAKARLDSDPDNDTAQEALARATFALNAGGVWQIFLTRFGNYEDYEVHPEKYTGDIVIDFPAGTNHSPTTLKFHISDFE